MKITHVPYASLKTRSETFQNPRTQSGLEEQEIRELAISIGWHGLLNAIHVTPDNVITKGQRRYLAIGYLIQHATELGDACAGTVATTGSPFIFRGRAHELPQRFRDRAAALLEGVPVVVAEPEEDIEGAAMADNLARVDLSSYEIAAEIARMHGRGDTGADIAARIGRSPSYVSKALKAWRGASAALKEAWRDGTVSYDRVKELADLQEEDQERALVGGKPRGGHGRPGIDAVKDALDGAARMYGPRAQPQSYASGVLDALRWVSGQTSSETFAEFMESIEP